MPLFERGCCTPSPPVIRDAPDPTLAALDRHPGDRPQVADRERGRRAARADQAEATSGPHLESVAPPATLPAFAAPAAGSLQPQRAVPDHRRARPLAFSRRLSARKAAHTPRTQPSARHHSRAGTSRRVGALVRLNADLWSDSAAARRCPWQQQVPPHHPPAASASLSHATPPPMHTQTPHQIPPRPATFAAMRPPPALIVTTRLLSYTFLPSAGERTAAAAVEPRVG